MVYVDILMKARWKYGQSCHLTADSIKELMMFASRIGLNHKWLHKSRNGTYHFDLTNNKRDLAVNKGAINMRDKRNNKLDNILECLS